MSEEASADTWTCEVRMRGPALPDLASLVRCLEEAGQGARLRGVEADAGGWLSEEEGELWLRLEGSAERVRLAPAARAVQWDATRERERRLTPEERGAYERLRRDWRRLSPWVRIIGPFARDERGALLEVRELRWR